MVLGVEAGESELVYTCAAVNFGNLAHTLELAGEVELAPFQIGSETVSDSRNVAVADGGDVLFVDCAVAVDVLIHEVAHTRGADAVHLLGALKLFWGVDVAVAVGVVDEVTPALSEAVAGGAVAVGVCFVILNFVDVADGVLVVGEVAVDAEVEFFVDALVPYGVDFDT